MCMYMYMCLSGDKKCSFFRKCSVLCFLVTTVLRFVLLPYYRQIVENMLRSKKMVSLTTPPLLLKQNQLLLILFNDTMKQYKKINLTIKFVGIAWENVKAKSKIITAKNTVISPNFLVWKFFWKGSLRIASGDLPQVTETVLFHKMSTPENQVKLRYFLQQIIRLFIHF